ncbi:MAG: outer membrane protein assembly factor BamB family protein [Actinomycetota bacterium]
MANRRVTRLALMVVFVSSLAAVGAHATVCGASASSRGEWPSYGGDKANSRNQALETTIGVGNAASLAPKWVFNVGGAGGNGGIQSTPAVSDGCLFFGTDAGDVFAVSSSDGSLVWHDSLPIGGQVGGIFGLAVSNGLVYGNTVDENGPFGFALDESTGNLVWRSESLSSLGNTTNASAVIWNGLDVVAIWGTDPDPTNHDGFAVLDATTGAVLAKTYVIPPADWAQGYAGGGIWGTMAIDTATGYGYVGTANPYSKTKEHQNTNAILKIDLNRGSPTFAQIVGSYHGTPDNYVGGVAYDNPACSELGPQQTSYATLGCFQQDLDFGASPNLWTDSNGNLMVGDQQKAGVYHGVDATTMKGAWQQIDSAPFELGNAGTATVSGNSIIASSNPGVVWAFNKTLGTLEWVAPTLDGVRYEAMSSANGVVYTTDNLGGFEAFDASSGMLLTKRSIRVDAGGGSGAPSDPTNILSLLGAALNSGGVSIAEGEIFAPNGGSLVAYGL